MLNELGNFMRGADVKRKQMEEEKTGGKQSSEERNEKNLLASYEYTKAIQKMKDTLREGDTVSFMRDGRRFVGKVVSIEINHTLETVRNVGLSGYTVLVEVVANQRTGAKYRCAPRYSEVTRL